MVLTVQKSTKIIQYLKEPTKDKLFKKSVLVT